MKQYNESLKINAYQEEEINVEPITAEHRLDEHERKIKNLEEQVAALKNLLQQQRDWMVVELKKFDDPKILEKAIEDGDIVLQKKWRVPGEALFQAAHDTSTKDVRNLFDHVFGEALLSQFKKIDQFPPDLKAASDELIGIFLLFHNA